MGPNRIPNEFIKNAPDNVLKLIMTFFNLNLEKGAVASSWCLDFVSPIHKEGPLDDPANYRGLVIMNSLLKLLCNILHNRLVQYCEDNKILNKEQIRFCRNTRTSDHILTLKTLVNKYVTDTRGKKLYTCFIDLRKAFDSIWHDGLFRKLENLGVNGNFLEIIKNIFKKTTCAVKLNGKITNFFPYDKGVQQGNPISPLLFNLYVNDIFQHIANKDPVSLNNTTLINALMYADDLSLLSTSKDGLQSSLTSLHEYCHKWRLDINHKKSKVMVFSRGTQKEKNKYTINNIPLDIVKDYKYLGITLNSKNCSFVQTLSNLQVKGTTAMYSLLSHLPLKLLSIKTLLRLFDSCIAPIITYGSEVWGLYYIHIIIHYNFTLFLYFRLGLTNILTEQYNKTLLQWRRGWD